MDFTDDDIKQLHEEDDFDYGCDEWFGGPDERMCIEEVKYDTTHGWRGLFIPSSASEPVVNILARLKTKMGEKIKAHEIAEGKKFKVTGRDCINMGDETLWVNLENVTIVERSTMASIGEFTDYEIGTDDIETMGVKVDVTPHINGTLLCSIIVCVAYHHTS